MDHFTPLEYLMIDAASAFGLDRADWNERIGWFKANQANLKNMVHEAKEPAMFFAAVEAFDAASNGIPTGHMVSLDATASGIQILSLLAGDASAARHCNVLNTGHRQDAYTNVDTIMRSYAQFDHIDRKQSKQALMTVFYGSEAVPKRVFGEGSLLQLFETICEQEFPAVWRLNRAMLAMWNPQALEYNWLLPDNFHVKTKVTGTVGYRVNFMGSAVMANVKVNEPQPEGRSIGANLVHSIDGYFVREMTRRCSYDPAVIAQARKHLQTGGGMGRNRHKDKMLLTLNQQARDTGMMSIRAVDYIDSDNADLIDREWLLAVLDTLPAKPFSMLSTHDCFRCHPNYAEDMRIQYNRQLAELNESRMLDYLSSQILGTEVYIQKLDQISSEEILASNYALS